MPAIAHTPLAPPVILSARSDDYAMAKDSDGSGTPRILVQLDLSALQQFAQPARQAAGAIPKISGVRVQFRRGALDGTTNGAAAWSSTQAYVVGDTVTDSSGQFWMCVIPNTDHPVGTTQAPAAWSGATAYNVGDFAAYGGGVWLCLEANANQAPGTLDLSGNPYWSPASAPPYWHLISNGVTPSSAPAAPWTEMGLQTLSRFIYIHPVSPSVLYAIRMRYEMTDGSVTPWATIANSTVAGQTTLPPDVSGLGAIDAGDGIAQLSWTPLHLVGARRV